ncbi:aryl-sulfate sulfotransferase [bacterium]|nr:aryl-sulfate sulfotransferase [bacterium]
MIRICSMFLLAVFLLFGSLTVSPVSAIDVVLPDEFFDYTYTGNPDLAADGYFYSAISVGGRRGQPSKSYLTIFDNQGDVVWFRKSDDGRNWMNLAPLDNHEIIAYGLGGTQTAISFALMDMSYTVYDTLLIPQDNPDVNPYNYRIDTHELFMDDGGNFWTLCRYDSTMDMTQYVGEGAHEDAVVTGHAIVQLDPDQNIIWEWRSLDHLDRLPFTELDSAEVFGEEVEHTHANGIAMDADGDLYFCLRGYSQVIMIDRETGEVDWKMGLDRGNEFEFIDDIEHEAFSKPHDFRWIEEGRFTIFDNGNEHDPPTSYAKEYSFDDDAMTATLEWHYVADPPVYAFHTGSTRCLENGNTLIGWGHDSPIAATEATIDGEIAWQIEIPSDTAFGTGAWSVPYSYRYLKSTMLGDPVVPYVIEELNDQTVTLYCNWFAHESDVGSYNIYLGTEPDPEDLVGNTFTGIYELTDLEYNLEYFIRIKAVDILGSEISDYSNTITVTPLSGVDDLSGLGLPESWLLEQNYPNPFNPGTEIKVHLPHTSRLQLYVHDLLGREVAELYNGVATAGIKQFSFNGNELTSGVYFVRAVIPGKMNQTRKMVLMK